MYDTHIIRILKTEPSFWQEFQNLKKLKPLSNNILSLLCRTSRKALKAETGEIVDEKEHDSAELGFMFETPDDDDEEGSDEQSDDESEQVNFFTVIRLFLAFSCCLLSML